MAHSIPNEENTPSLLLHIPILFHGETFMRIQYLFVTLLAGLLFLQNVLFAQKTVDTVPNINGMIFERWDSTGDVTIEKTQSANSPTDINSKTGKMAVTAKYVAPAKRESYLIRIEGRGNVEPAPNRLVEFAEGSDHVVKLKATPTDDSRFSGWRVEGDVRIENPAAAETSAQVNGRNCIIIAVFEATRGTVEISARGSGTVVPAGNLKLKTGEIHALKAIPNDDASFERWEVSGQATLTDPGTPETGVVLKGYYGRVTAVFTRLLQNYAVPLPDDSRYSENGGGGSSSAQPAAQLILSIQTSPGGTTDPKPGTYSGVKSRLPVKAIPDDTAVFKCWELSGKIRMDDPSKSATDAYVYDHASLRAVFTPIYSILQTEVSGNGQVTPKPGELKKVKTAEPVAVSAVPAEGFRFVTWQIIRGKGTLSASNQTSATISLEGDVMLRAVFAKVEEKNVKLPPPPPPRREPKPAEQMAVIDSLVQIRQDGTIEANPPPGYFFSSWEIKGKARVDSLYARKTRIHFEQDASTANTSVRAIFSPDMTQLKMEIEGKGTTLPAAQETPHSLRADTKHSVQAIPAAGQRFVRWTVIGGAELKNATDPKTEVMLSSSAILTAHFEKTPNMLTVIAGDGGSVRPSGTVGVQENQTCKLEAIPMAGFRFVGWQSKGQVSLQNRAAPSTVANVSGDATATAVFAPDKVLLVVAVSGEGKTTPESCTRVELKGGEEIALAVKPGAEWTFVNWIQQGDVVVADPAKQVTTVKVNNGTAIVIANLMQLERRRSENKQNVAEELVLEAEKLKKAAATAHSKRNQTLDTQSTGIEQNLSKESWVVATDGLYDGKVRVFWRYSGAETFEVQRMTLGEKDAKFETLIDLWPGTHFEDSSAKPYITYLYRVIAKGKRNKFLSSADDTGFSR